MFQRNSNLCVLVGKQMNEKYILRLCLESVEVGGYDFLDPCVCPGTVTYFYQSLVHTV
jgi:hypothetical protein